MDEAWFLLAAGLMSVLNIIVILRRTKLADFQTTLFRISMLTGWVLLIAVLAMDPTPGPMMLD
jgi:hypothetical protein